MSIAPFLSGKTLRDSFSGGTGFYMRNQSSAVETFRNLVQPICGYMEKDHGRQTAIQEEWATAVRISPFSGALLRNRRLTFRPQLAK